MAMVAVIAFAFGAAVGHRPSEAIQAAEKYAAAWERSDFKTMHALLTPGARSETPLEDFVRLHERAQTVATVEKLTTDKPEKEQGSDGAMTVPVQLHLVTQAFGAIDGPVELVYRDGGIEWDEHLVFPGLEEGETLASRIELPRRASILTRDGVPLAEGPADARSSPLGGAAIDVAGSVGSADEETQQRLIEFGLPAGTLVGVSGLEKAFNRLLMGTPGGELVAQTEGGGERTLVDSEPQQAAPLKTTIDSELQIAAVGALAGRSGGIVALDARNGAVRALAGQAYSAPQPPGSTYKVLTTLAALEKKLIKLDDYYEPVQGVNVTGRFIRNAHSEYCGGDFREVFARSCNSAFLPLGPELGEEAMVEIAERFGFNSPPQLYNREATAVIDPPSSTIPTEMDHQEELAVSAIGQGRVLATPLQMASVTQAIANRGVLMPTSIVQHRELRPDAKPVRVMSKRASRILTDLMVGVVVNGTGVSGAIAGAQVAGKTGTAELGPKPGQTDLGPDETPEQMVDAWFIAFAPAEKPQLAVAVMLIDADADGGTVAAPAAAQVLATGVS